MRNRRSQQLPAYVARELVQLQSATLAESKKQLQKPQEQAGPDPETETIRIQLESERLQRIKLEEQLEVAMKERAKLENDLQVDKESIVRLESQIQSAESLAAERDRKATEKVAATERISRKYLDFQRQAQAQKSRDQQEIEALKREHQALLEKARLLDLLSQEEKRKCVELEESLDVNVKMLKLISGGDVYKVD